MTKEEKLAKKAAKAEAAKLKKEAKEAAKAAKKAAAIETKPTSTAETKEEKPAEQKPAVETPPVVSTSTKKKPKKEEKKPEPEPVDVEEVDPTEGIGSLSNGLAKIANGGRISDNQGIALMTSIQKEYLEKPDAPEELRKAMRSQFDVMAMVYLAKWNLQTEKDFKEVGITMNEGAFQQLSASISESLGITLKGTPTDNGQLKIDFKESMETAPTDVKESIEKEAKRPIVSELPVYDSSMTEEQALDALRDILSMKNGLDGNLQNAILFARKAFDIESAEPHKVVATILVKLSENKPIMLRGFQGMSYGSISQNDSAFSAHARFHHLFSKFKYTESQIAGLVKVFTSAMIAQNCKSSGNKFEDCAIPYAGMLKLFNDDLINKIIKNSKDASATVKLPSVKGLIYGNEFFNSAKIVDDLKKEYGKDLSDKLLKKKMQEIAAFYFDDIKPLNELSK